MHWSARNIQRSLDDPEFGIRPKRRIAGPAAPTAEIGTALVLQRLLPLGSGQHRAVEVPTTLSAGLGVARLTINARRLHLQPTAMSGPRTSSTSSTPPRWIGCSRPPRRGGTASAITC